MFFLACETARFLIVFTAFGMMVSFLAIYLIGLKIMEELASALLSTFEDYRLSKGEKTAFRELLMEYQEDTDALNFVRNKAFDIVNIQMQKQQSFDMSGFKFSIAKVNDFFRACHGW
ncbi:hypothetical protein A9Q81_16825 [Gammaproteobacteria bacterium 42_54_T18]|nr:hypothetical protein A9Q81_16825 [Gammaproteobacteria bacterium 42_54_T18]